MAERRRYPRSRVLKTAKLVVGRSSLLNCVVRNLTNVGARIAIANTVELPENLEMTFDGGRSLRRCRLVWRNLNTMGVEFLPDKSS